LALFNFNAVDASITLVLRDTGGQQIATTQRTLRSRGHSASFISGPGQIFLPSRISRGRWRSKARFPLRPWS